VRLSKTIRPPAIAPAHPHHRNHVHDLSKHYFLQSLMLELKKEFCLARLIHASSKAVILDEVFSLNPSRTVAAFDV
jgi:hypothetical protein